MSSGVTNDRTPPTTIQVVRTPGGDVYLDGRLISPEELERLDGLNVVSPALRQVVQLLRG